MTKEHGFTLSPFPENSVFDAMLMSVVYRLHLTSLATERVKELHGQPNPIVQQKSSLQSRLQLLKPLLKHCNIDVIHFLSSSNGNSCKNLCRFDVSHI